MTQYTDKTLDSIDYEAIRNRINQDNHFLQSSRMHVKEIRNGYAVVEMSIDEQIQNIYGLVHGGALLPWRIRLQELPVFLMEPKPLHNVLIFIFFVRASAENCMRSPLKSPARIQPLFMMSKSMIKMTNFSVPLTLRCFFYTTGRSNRFQNPLFFQNFRRLRQNLF